MYEPRRDVFAALFLRCDELTKVNSAGEFMECGSRTYLIEGIRYCPRCHPEKFPRTVPARQQFIEWLVEMEARQIGL